MLVSVIERARVPNLSRNPSLGNAPSQNAMPWAAPYAYDLMMSAAFSAMA